MKKIISVIAVALVALALSSCRKEEHIGMQTVLITVRQSDWVYTNQDNNNYFYATVDMPEITEDVFDMGLVKMYRTFNYESSNASQIEMPYVRSMERYLSDYDDWEFYTETTDYEYGIGSMTIFFTMGNFDYEIDESIMPDEMQFRCVIVY